jgi:NusA-like KH domain protein
MEQVIDMQKLRYLNLFNQVTRVPTQFCFIYNNILFFCVQKKDISKAIGPGARNIRRIGEVTKKRIKIIQQPKTIKDVQKFISSVVEPVEFKDLQINESEISVSGSRQDKAALIGRDKKRLLEMKNIIKVFFNKDFIVV